MQYTFNTTSEHELFSHLSSVDATFNPALSSLVDIKEYANKLFLKAFRFEAFEDNKKLIGLLAGYINTTFFFLSVISVEPEYQGKGISTNLFDILSDFLKTKMIDTIELEVYKTNLKAIGFYKKLNFKPFSETEKSFLFRKQL